MPERLLLFCFDQAASGVVTSDCDVGLHKRQHANNVEPHSTEINTLDVQRTAITRTCVGL
jgi:hypothetical protein